MGRISRDYL